jgi:outer membrane protein assembly factor BamB
MDNWASPAIAQVGERNQVICLGTGKITGYDLATGKREWELEGLERLCSCTPVARGDRLYAVSGPNGAALAIDLGAKPTPQVVWRSTKTGPFVPSPIVVGEYFYMANDQGVLTCLDVGSGKEIYRERLPTGRMRPSPVAWGDKICFLGLDGNATVIQAGKEFKVLAKNKLGEDLAASPALARGRLFLRGANHLWCLGD